MTIKKTLIYILSIFIFSSCNQEKNTTKKNNPITNSLDNYFTKNIENGFSGSVLVSKDEEIILSKGYGFADIKREIRNTPKTIFDIGSNTKQFTATAILKLVELNKLKLTDALSSYFNNIPLDKKDITIHQLLTHSSGLENFSGNDFDIISKEDFLKKEFASKLQFPPGTEYSYSNVGYSLLAIIIEQVSGLEYEHFLNLHLFQPAGMSQTGYLLPSWKEDKIAVGYHRGYRNIGTMPKRYNEIGVTWHLKGNGGINSSIEDMYKWYIALKENKIISKSLKQNLFAPHIVSSIEHNNSYGYGWGVSQSNRKTKIASHSGANPAFYSDIFIFVEEDVFIIYCTNKRTEELEYLAWDFQNLIFDPNYIPKKIQKNKYKVLFEFILINNPEKVTEILPLFEKEFGNKLEDANLLNRLGYYSIGKPYENWAVPLLKLNLSLFPDDGNLWDSLGEAYASLNEKEKAINSFEKALKLKPNDNCGWCENSISWIEKLTAN